MKRTPAAEQGPDWLADVLLTPPSWLKVLFVVAGAAIGLAAVWRLSRRSWKVSVDQQEEMLQTALLFGCIMLVAGTLRPSVDWPFWIEALAAFGGGSILSITAYRVHRPSFQADPNLALSAWWAIVVLIAIALPLTGLSSQLIGVGQSYLGLLGIVMIVYNWTEIDEAAPDS